MYQQSYQSMAAHGACGSIQSQAAARRTALNLYRWACLVGWARQQWAKLCGRPHDLLDLTVAQRAVATPGEHSMAIRAVPLAAIRGSEGRCRDFGTGFYPQQSHSCERWVSVAAARLQGVALPRVILIQVGDAYYVRDGHHRISVAYALGEMYIDAEVI